MKIRVKIAEQAFEVEIGDLQARPIQAVVDGETFEVWPEEIAAPVPVVAAIPTAPSAPAAPAPVAAPAAIGGDRSKQVFAPIPGTILSVIVKEGQEVTFGQELATLEAMKMKSAIRSNRAGKIVKIRISAGDRVGQNQALMDYGD